MSDVQHGYLALIDVLGFSDLVLGDEGGTRIRDYLDYLGQITAARGVGIVAFSDSIVVTAKGGEESSFLKVASTCSVLLFNLLGKEIAVRGAISYGQFIREAPVGAAESVFVGGRAVLDAFRYEKLQDWVGIMVAPSALIQLGRDNVHGRCLLPHFKQGQVGVQTVLTSYQRNNIESRIEWAAIVQRCKEIPFHPEHPSDPPDFDGVAIVPTNGNLTVESVRDCIGKSARQLRLLRDLAPSPRAQRKYDKTIKWLADKSDFWTQLAKVQKTE